ncbi:uncharacterized protein LOC143074101 [Mytilus galloprovincialis]|uniref:uncharacterized protein LOC143074101 n=1 Tax=Mytilus galloprovincialis TaxID=29158 RepID=UPI003F7BE62C
MVKVVEKSLSEHGDIMPLDVDSLRSKENSNIIIYPDTSSDNEISQSSEFMDLKYVKKFADKTNEQRNITENPVKIKIDVIRQERKIEVRKEIEKSNDSITDQFKPNNDKIIPDKKQNIDVQQTSKIGGIPTKKRRRRKKKQKNVVPHSDRKEGN